MKFFSLSTRSGDYLKYLASHPVRDEWKASSGSYVTFANVPLGLRPSWRRFLSVFALLPSTETALVFWPLVSSWVLLGEMRVDVFGIFALISILFLQAGAYGLAAYFEFLSDPLRRDARVYQELAQGPLVIRNWSLALLLLASVMGGFVLWQNPLDYLPPVCLALVGVALLLRSGGWGSAIQVEVYRALVYGPALFWGLGLFFYDQHFSWPWLAFGFVWGGHVLSYAALKNLTRLLRLLRARQNSFFLRFGGFDRMAYVFLMFCAVLGLSLFAVVYALLGIFAAGVMTALFSAFSAALGLILHSVRSPLSSRLKTVFHLWNFLLHVEGVAFVAFALGS